MTIMRQADHVKSRTLTSYVLQMGPFNFIQDRSMNSRLHFILSNLVNSHFVKRGIAKVVVAVLTSIMIRTFVINKQP